MSEKSCSLCGSILRKGRFKFVIIMIPRDRMGPQCRVNFYIEIFRDKSLNLFFKKARKDVSFVIASGSVLYWLIWNSVKSCSPGLLSRGRGSLTLFVKINYFQKHKCNSNLFFLMQDSWQFLFLIVKAMTPDYYSTQQWFKEWC